MHAVRKQGDDRQDERVLRAPRAERDEHGESRRAGLLPCAVAILSGFNVSLNQTVGYGKVIGWVGSTGNSSGPHLHYEQRYNGNDIQVRFNGALALYWGTKTYTSDNNCATATGTVNTAGSPLNVRSGPGTGYSIVGTVADGQRVCRISFSGELAYEIAVPARHGELLARTLMEKGADLGVTPLNDFDAPVSVSTLTMADDHALPA